MGPVWGGGGLADPRAQGSTFLWDLLPCYNQLKEGWETDDCVLGHRLGPKIPHQGVLC